MALNPFQDCPICEGGKIKFKEMPCPICEGFGITNKAFTRDGDKIIFRGISLDTQHNIDDIEHDDFQLPDDWWKFPTS